MTFPWRAVVTDLDGTVVPRADVISEATLAAAGRLAAAGIPLVAVTARTPAGVDRLGEFAGFLALAVGNNGARGWVPSTGAILWQELISPAELRDLAAFTSALPGTGMSVFGVDAWKMTAGYVALRGQAPAEPWQSATLEDLAARPAYAAALRHKTLESDDLIALLTEAGFDARLNLTYSANHLVDIGPPGVDKATGTRRALAALGRDPGEAVAFGDMPNDLPMLACCGLAIAVGNAHPAVRAAAGLITAPAAEDGFARALTSLGLPGPAIPGS